MASDISVYMVEGLDRNDIIGKLSSHTVTTDEFARCGGKPSGCYEFTCVDGPFVRVITDGPLRIELDGQASGFAHAIEYLGNVLGSSLSEVAEAEA